MIDRPQNYLVFDDDSTKKNFEEEDPKKSLEDLNSRATQYQFVESFLSKPLKSRKKPTFIENNSFDAFFS